MQYDDSLFTDTPAPAQSSRAGQMDESLFSDQPATPSGKSLAGLGANAVKDAGQIGSSVANLAGNMIAHPIDTTSQVVKGLPGAIGAWAKELGIPEALHGQFSDAVSKFGNSAYEHPVSRALDVGSIALPALKGAGILDAGAKGAEIAADAGKAGDLFTDASRALGRRELGSTKRFINTTDKMDAANAASDWANTKGVMGRGLSPEDKLGEVRGLKDDAWNRMNSTYGSPELAGKSLQAQPLIDRLNGMRPRDAHGNVLSGGDYEALNNEIDKKIENIKAFKGDIPWQNAQDLKNIMKKSTAFDLTQPNQINDLRKRLSGSFRGGMDEQLESALGADKMGEYNAAKSDYGMSKNVIKSLENRVSSSAGNRLGGATDWLAGGAGMAHGGPLVGMAVVAGKKLVERYGLDLGSHVLSKLANGKYANVFAHLTTFGPAELQTLHTIAENDPQFAQELSDVGSQQ